MDFTLISHKNHPFADISDKLREELAGKPIMEQAQKFFLQEHSREEFDFSGFHLGYVNGFFYDFKMVKALISHNGLFVGYVLSVSGENHEEGEKPILVGQTVWNGWERHVDTSGDNNGSGYKGGEDYYTKTYVTLIPY